MLVAVADAAAIEDQRLVEQGAVAVRRRPELLQEAGEQAHLVGVDHGVLLEPLRVQLVVRHGVVRVGDADFREALRGLLAPDEEGEDAGDVGLEGERLEVEHQPGVLVERLRDAHRPLQHLGQGGVGLRLGPPDAPLDFAHRVQVLRHARAVGGAERPLQPRHVLAHRVQDAAVVLQPDGALRLGASLPEQPLEDDARVVLHRERRRRGAPREGVGVDAAIAVVAVADDEAVLERQLQRRQRRLPADRGGGDLVGGGARPHVGALGPLRVDAVQPDGARPRMLAVAVAPRLRLPVVEAGRDDHLVPHVRQRLEAAGERQRTALAGRGPLRHVRAVRDVDEAEPRRGLRGGLRQRGRGRNHRVEQRQGHGGAHPAQEGPPRQ